LLTNAPAVVGDARKIADRYEAYRDQLQRLVANVGRIYGTVSTLPVYEPDTTTTRVLHISDMHLSLTAWSLVSTVVEQFDIDIVVDTGDITDWGQRTRGSYVASIASLHVPYIFIRGNHDSKATADAVARQPNARVLDNTVTEVDGLVIAGISDPRFTPDKSADGRRRWRGRANRSRRRSAPPAAGSTWRWCTTRRPRSRSPGSVRSCWQGTSTSARSAGSTRRTARSRRRAARC
jgi:hypothetical protein